MTAAAVCIAGLGAIALILLAAIDLRTRLLPNRLVLPLAVLGVTFHLVTRFSLLSCPDMIAGGAYGFGSLFLLRAASNHLAQTDTLGLGDVKLMGAGGLWLGPTGIMAAMAAGAAISLAAGFCFTLYRRLAAGEHIPLSSFTLPAGPGFALGLAIVGLAGWNRSMP